jgi:hypothetical protein
MHFLQLLAERIGTGGNISPPIQTVGVA